MHILVSFFLFILLMLFIGLFIIGRMVSRFIHLIKPAKKRNSAYSNSHDQEASSANTSSYAHPNDKFFDRNEGEYVEFEETE